MNATIQKFEKTQIIRKSVPFKVGDTVKVSLRIKEGEKERIQVYEGVVTGIQNSGAKMRFTVRKISYGVGVEKTFYYQSPMIKDVKTVRAGKVRRAKLFYLRGKLNKKDARIQESKKGIQVPSEGAAETAQTATVAAEAPAAPAPEAKAPEAKVPETKAEKKEKA
ncbi:MAG TPA: 50S ribosomal protein L19 [bacterium]|nr:50S ribosomal protein L19 [bacterium]